MTRIKFSLIMAAYNAEEYIEEAILSVINQKYENWELIIVDDGSVDSTYKIINDYSKSDSRILAIHQSNSGTAAAARNTALKYITGEYVQMLDSDDLIHENLLVIYAKKLQNKNFDILVPNCICFERDSINDIYWKKNAPQNRYDQVITGEKAFELSLDWSIHGFFLVKNILIQKIKYDPTLINGDEFTTRKLYFNAHTIGFVDSYYYYRRNMNSTTKNIMNRYRMYESLITDMNIYNYALNNNMRQEIINICAKKLVMSHFIYSKKFAQCVKNSLYMQEKEYAYNILKQIFLKLNLDILQCSHLKYRIFYTLSRGKFNRFVYMMKYLVKFGRS